MQYRGLDLHRGPTSLFAGLTGPKGLPRIVSA
jgi:hypothetical protein